MAQFADDDIELRRPTRQVARKGQPLPLLPKIGRKAVAESVRNFNRDHRVATGKGGGDGSAKASRLAFERAREHPRVVVHAAIGPSKRDHRMKRKQQFHRLSARMRQV